jgi:hypothetical protein
VDVYCVVCNVMLMVLCECGMSASTDVRHMLNNSIIMQCHVCGLLTYQTPRVCTVRLFIKQPLYIHTYIHTYICTYVHTYKGKGTPHLRRGHEGPEGE